MLYLISQWKTLTLVQPSVRHPCSLHLFMEENPRSNNNPPDTSHSRLPLDEPATGATPASSLVAHNTRNPPDPSFLFTGNEIEKKKTGGGVGSPIGSAALVRRSEQRRKLVGAPVTSFTATAEPSAESTAIFGSIRHVFCSTVGGVLMMAVEAVLVLCVVKMAPVMVMVVAVWSFGQI
ncbi:hypothetical protein Hanom_Chr03g00208791 [Helianthus anomalus]